MRRWRCAFSFPSFATHHDVCLVIGHAPITCNMLEIATDQNIGGVGVTWYTNCKYDKITAVHQLSVWAFE